jgi:hypothetical protein
MLEESPAVKFQPDQEYLRSKDKMESNISNTCFSYSLEHHGHCVASQKRKTSKSPPKKDIKVSFDAANERLLILKD